MYLGDSSKLKEALVFLDNPPASEATQRNMWPFTVVISAADTGDHYVDLYSQYSRSRPYQSPQSTWSHLLPQWRFTDLDGNVVSKIKTTDTIITDISGNTIGVTGTAQFYYIDDMPSIDYTSPVMIWGTLEVSGRPVDYDINHTPLPGYANSKIIKGEPYYINGQPPTFLDITSNGIRPISKLKWINNPFRYTTVIKSNWLSGLCPNYTGDIIIFDYPQQQADAFAASHEIYRDVLYTPTSAENWLPLSAYFERQSEEGFHIGGFHIGSVESSDVALNTQISAIVDIQDWGRFRDTPYVWVSNGEFERIHRIALPYTFGGSAYTNPLLPNIQTYSYNASGLGSYSSPTSSVSGTPYWKDAELKVDIFGGIHGIAVTPCLDVWAVDPELDQMFNFNVRGNMVTAIDILPIGSSPQSIVLDSEQNMWVTLYGATSAVKFDRYGAETGIVAVPPYEITDQFSVTADNPDIIRVRPVQAETDTLDNVWVTYEHPISSMALKYDSSGTFLTACNLPISAQPQGIVVNPLDNSVWVSNTYEILVDPMSWAYAASGGSIQHFSSAGNLLETYEDLPHPGYLTLDMNQNLWFTFGYRGVGVISGTDVTKFWLSGQKIVDYGTPAHLEIDGSLLGFNDRIKGIAADGRNRIWALDSRRADIFVINGDDLSDYEVIEIVPQDETSVDVSIQAMGDWTGYHWLHKYFYSTSLPEEYAISGISNTFNIDEFGTNLDIRKFNESWDATEQIHNYALSEHVYEHINLFENYFRAMVGGLLTEEESIGRKSYERIANFVQNHVDIDTCGIDQLYSLANQLDVPIDDYNLNFPISLKRLMDIISISHNRLWGTRCKCRRNFKLNAQTCTECGHNHCLNRSRNPININTYQISGGDQVVIKPYFGAENYDVLTTPDTVLSGGVDVSVYPISAASSISWLLSSNYNNFYFYRYIPTFCNVQVEGVINWDDEYTTLSETNSSLSAWYGENELIDIMLNYDLHKGLQFELS